jgi:IMP cyclohydrolase
VTSYYVYYRVEAGQAASLQEEVRQLFRSVELATGVRGRWMRRRDEPTTYMEIYEDVENEPAFEALLEREAAKLALQRHVERFVCA